MSVTNLNMVVSGGVARDMTKQPLRLIKNLIGGGRITRQVHANSATYQKATFI
jgi:hypothetical protein